MNNSKVTLAGAFALSIGIAIQNVPEGFIVSLPVRSEKGRIKAFLYGMLSGIVEPIGGGITILLASKITPVLPYLLAFAAGAMIYVVTEELIPESQSDRICTGVCINDDIRCSFGLESMKMNKRRTCSIK